jgi:NADH-quinone oxidoreductase subunit L
MDHVILNPFVAWIAAFPLLGAMLNGFLLSWLGRLLPRRTREGLVARGTVQLIAVLSVAFSLAVAVTAALFLWRGRLGVDDVPPQAIVARLWNWLPLADMTRGVPALGDALQSAELYVPVSFLVDRLSALMAVTVSGVSFLIHVYSMGYMGRDKDFRRYFTYLNLFVFFMLVLVLADNLVLMFVGWEGVGLCSYLLIGFWFDKQANAVAGKKAFIVNRIGDFGFLLGIFCLAAWLGTVRFQGLSLPGGGFAEGINDVLAQGGAAALPSHTALGVSGGFLVCMLLFLGAAGKSAQIPLCVWLPDAMAGPTPVSALIHAATMVTAGVYMIVRLGALFVLSPTAMAVIATIGAFTALFAATIGLTQFDIKKVLAYSTISQLGYMFLAVGVGAFSAGMFHLFTHAFFKACLFLCAGAVIHALHERQDIREMGGLRRTLPVTHWTFLVSTLAIAGFPPFSGFFSKDEILWTAFSGSAIVRSGLVPNWWPTVLWAMGLAAAVCTAFYMFRLYLLVFHGESRAPDEVRAQLHAPELKGPAAVLWTEPHTPVSMRVVLMLLGAAAVVAGFVGMPHLFGVPNLFERWLDPAVLPFAGGAGDVGMEWTLLGLSVLVAGAGAFLAWSFYRSWPPQPAQGVIAAVPRLYKLVLDKYRIDELYGWIVVRPLRALAFAAYEFVDRVLIDTILVTGTAWVVRGIGGVFRKLQGGVIHRYAALMALGLVGLLFFVAQPFATVPLLERPVRFLRYVGQDTASGAARLALLLPGAPYVYQLDLDSDGVAEADIDPRAPVYDVATLRGDVLLACLPAGDHVLTAIARSGFGLVRTLRIPISIVGPTRCEPWTVIEDPRWAKTARADAPRAATIILGEPGVPAAEPDAPHPAPADPGGAP